MEKSYRDLGIETYGDKCEICGHSAIEVHHIDYQEHQSMEDRLRKVVRDEAEFNITMKKAKAAGYPTWEFGQLAKCDESYNLSVLCGNCHTLMHKMDVGKKILKALKPRR